MNHTVKYDIVRILKVGKNLFRGPKLGKNMQFGAMLLFIWSKNKMKS